MMQPKISFRSWVRTVVFSVLAAFALQGIIDADEMKAAFHNGSNWRRNFSAIQASLPDYLRVPEIVAGAVGKLWQWFN